MVIEHANYCAQTSIQKFRTAEVISIYRPILPIPHTYASIYLLTNFTITTDCITWYNKHSLQLIISYSWMTTFSVDFSIFLATTQLIIQFASVFLSPFPQHGLPSHLLPTIHRHQLDLFRSSHK